MKKDLILREKLALQRTSLANQSTLLAFLRTAIYFLVAGITVDKLVTLRFGHMLEIVFFTIAAILLITGLVNYKIQLKKIIESEKHIGDYKVEYDQKS